MISEEEIYKRLVIAKIIIVVFLGTGMYILLNQ